MLPSLTPLVAQKWPIWGTLILGHPMEGQSVCEKVTLASRERERESPFLPRISPQRPVILATAHRQHKNGKQGWTQQRPPCAGSLSTLPAPRPFIGCSWVMSECGWARATSPRLCPHIFGLCGRRRNNSSPCTELHPARVHPGWLLNTDFEQECLPDTSLAPEALWLYFSNDCIQCKAILLIAEKKMY